MKNYNIDELIKLILQNINKKNFEEALNIINNSPIIKKDTTLYNKLLSNFYFKKGDWKRSIDYFEKRLLSEKIKYGILNNIGVSYFNLGKIQKSIKLFKDSINENNNYDLSYENLGISYKEIGLYKDALNAFLNAVKINNSNLSAKENLLSIFNVDRTENDNSHPTIKCNYKISNLKNSIVIDKIISNLDIKKFLYETDNIINSYNQNFECKETQIFRKNTTNLNCKRHFEIFNEFKIIPKYCFSCYKVQIELVNVIDLIRLYFLFDNIILEKNNIRKCIIETRDNVKTNYKGYIYCSGLKESENIFNIVKKYLSKIGIIDHNTIIKHGCSEFAEEYTDYKKINFKGPQEMNYDESWRKKEKVIDDRIPKRSKNDEKKFNETLKGINLYDIFIIKNWLSYAKIIGDNSYKFIYEKKLNNSFLNNLLKNQLNFRNKELRF
tara:strand:- start:1692 stop:3008 length:1317 start_codon:yes stop_codon:yes gene_type:complete